MGCSTAPDPYFHCRISTITFLLLFEEAAFTTVRIAFAILPCRPITLPMSAGPTFSSTMIASSFSVSVTTTSSGFSTRDFAITSTNSFITYLPDPSPVDAAEIPYMVNLNYFSIPASLRIVEAVLFTLSKASRMGSNETNSSFISLEYWVAF